MKSIFATTIFIAFALAGCSTNPDPQLKGAPTTKGTTTERYSDESKSSSLFEGNGEVEGQIKSNFQMPLSRNEQIKLAVDAAISARVQPILFNQPRENLIYFSYSDYDVKDKWFPVLEKHARYISTNPSIRLMVAGFTDIKGSAKYNYKLGQKRSNSVCKKLIELGTRKEQLTCVSYGESHPVDTDHDEEAYARNRRTELLY